MTLKNTDDFNAVFTIKNKQRFDDREDLIEVKTEGKFYLKNTSYYLMYKEYTEMGEISVLLKATEDTVTIKRTGACNTRMEYREGYRQDVVYSVPFGDMLIELETHSLQNNLTVGGGCLEMKYKLDINHEIYYNDMRLEVNLLSNIG